MGKLGISFVEKRLLEHLRLGGSVRDKVGHDLVHKFIRKMWSEPEIHTIAVRHAFSPSDLAVIYAGTIDALMPAPWLNAGGPMLVPTAFFMESHRLEGLLIEINRDGQGLVGDERLGFAIEKAAEAGGLVKDMHDAANGPPNVQVLPQGGLPSSAGCMGSLLIVSVLLGSLFLLLR